MTPSLSATVAYSFVASAVVGLSASFLTERTSVKMGLLLTVCTTAGTMVGRVL
jgi:uncharacterized membrane protein